VESNYEHIIFELQGNVATLTLNRPRVLNAMNAPTVDEILDALDEVSVNDDIRALVITGAGRAFCSGDDLKGSGIKRAQNRPHTSDENSDDEMAVYGYSTGEAFRYKWHTMFRTIRNLRTPVIAAINGNAHGAGSDLMLACDFRLASEDAIFGDLRTANALALGTGAAYLMPQVVGMTKAIELLFTGKKIDAQEAERIGLVNKTVPADRFKDEVAELANSLAQGPTKLIGRVKEQIYRQANMDFAAALEDGWHDARDIEGRTEDGKEGMLAFLERRPPKYTGR
jgi:2-(1,2-epoxy-1,2-dihydrophenyl)acetyl-CoA isomerase